MRTGAVVMRGQAVLVYNQREKLLTCEGCKATISTAKLKPGQLDFFCVEHKDCVVK